MMKRIISRIISILFFVVFIVGLFPGSVLSVAAKEDQSTFWIKFIDVGQGDAALIQCDGHYMLIDGGPADASSVIYTILKESDINRLDYIIATHPDADHIGGLSGALNYATVGICYSPVTTHSTKTFKNLVKYLKKQNISVTVPAEGLSFKLGSAEVQLLGPIESSEDTNNNSIVTKITYGSTSFLFMGDAETEEEKSILDQKVDLDSDLIKIGHHGSKDSTSAELLKAVKPKYAIISVGADNTYDHPTLETLTRLSSINATIYRTDMHGDITCNSDGKHLTFSKEKKASKEALWLPGPSKNQTMIKNGMLVAAPKDIEIPKGTTYVINAKTWRFHLVKCSSVKEISEKNIAYSTLTAEELVSEGFIPCNHCNPYVVQDTKKQNNSQTPSETVVKESSSSSGSYVLNTNSKKFHKTSCSSVSDMSAKNRKDVNMSREEIINQGYSPCKRCNP
jgi:competence protein ComEC